jgi:uncharacterized membrane protein
VIEIMAKVKNSQASAPYRLHWHILLTHFPLSLYGTAFGFQILHLFMYPDCLELATTVTLIGATLMMPPAMITGWLKWKAQYNGAKIRLFQRKIIISFVMLAISLCISVWRVVRFEAFLVEPVGLAHWIFLLGVISLIAGALMEGYHGGKLSHK